MKLRTRITLISCAAVIAASLLTDAVIWILTKRSFWNEAFIKAYQNSYLIAAEFSERLESAGYAADEDVFVDYYFKTKWDEYNIAVRKIHKNGETQFEEIYNHTVFEGEELDKLEYETYESLSYASVKWEGKRYLVFCKDIKNEIVLDRKSVV